MAGQSAAVEVPDTETHAADRDGEAAGMSALGRFFQSNWRMLFYGFFVCVRIGRARADQVFPAFDGIAYYLKAAWIAAEPLTRALPETAFTVFRGRPPGSAWLTLPFLVWSPAFLVYATALFTWIVLFIEMGVRGLFPASNRQVRNVAAVLLLFGPAVFFVGFETFFIDHLYAAIAVACAGLAARWVRETRWRQAIAAGAALALAIWIKPAGLALLLCVLTALAVTVLCLQLQARASGLRAAGNGRRWLQLVLVGALAAPAVATLFVGPYSHAWLAYHPDRQINWQSRFLGALEPVDPTGFSLSGLLRVSQSLAELIGLPLAILALLVIVVMLLVGFPGSRRDPSRVAVPLYLALLTGGLLLFAWRTPVKPARYVGPVAAVLLCLLSAGPWTLLPSGKRVVTVLAAVALAWRGLYLAGAEPRLAWISVPRAFSHPMGEARGNAEALDARTTAGETNTLFHLIPVTETEAFALAQMGREKGLAHVGKQLGFRSAVNPYGPNWPAFTFEAFTVFLEADFVLVRRHGRWMVFPEGSRMADLIMLERRMWQPDVAKRGGLREFRRTSNVVLYETVAVDGRPVAAARAGLLFNSPLQSDAGRACAEALRTLAAVQAVAPPGRTFAYGAMTDGLQGVRIRSPHAGNPLPETLRLSVSRDEVLLLQAVDNGSGAGIRVELGLHGSKTELRLEPGDLHSIRIDALWERQNEAAAVLDLSFADRPMQDDAFEEVQVGLVPTPPIPTAEPCRQPSPPSRPLTRLNGR